MLGITKPLHCYCLATPGDPWSLQICSLLQPEPGKLILRHRLCFFFATDQPPQCCLLAHEASRDVHTSWHAMFQLWQQEPKSGLRPTPVSALGMEKQLQQHPTTTNSIEQGQKNLQQCLKAYSKLQAALDDPGPSNSQAHELYQPSPRLVLPPQGQEMRITDCRRGWTVSAL